MEFRVLGPLEVVEHGEVLALGGAKRRALLAILLLNANEVVSSDALIDELWGSKPPRTASKSLQILVSELRKALEPDRQSGASGRVLVTRSPGYALEIERDQLDLERFRALAAEGREALAAGDSAAAAQRLGSALSLWRGPPLADLAYLDFAQRQAPRLEDLRLAALEDRIQADLDCGRHSEVIGELEGLIAAEPLRERPRALLMLALYRSGRQAEALDAYGDARRALVDELGIEPGRELKELQAAILEQDPELDPAAPSRPSGREADAVEPGPAAAAPDAFVGRESELAEFQSAFDAALTGRMALFLIAGEPGIGKSTLADAWTSLAQARGAAVCWGRCWEAGGAPAYWPWVQAIRGYIREGRADVVRAQLEPAAADMAQMLPELHDQFPDLPPPPSLDPEGARFRLFDSTASFLRAAAGAQPLLLVIDDLHAADKPSLLLLQFLARSLHDARMVVVGAYRDTEPAGADDALSEAIADVRREPVTHPIRLGGLDVADVARVIERVGRTQPSDALAGAIHQETEGNPLFVSELVRLLASEGRLDEATGPPWRGSLPRGVREVIGHRLRQLSEDCKRLLSVAAVLGRDFRLDALERVSGLPRERILDLLDEARAARVVVERPAGLEGLRFSHALIRDGLYDDLATSERLRLHGAAVDGLEELYAADLEQHLAELAYHAFEAAPVADAGKAIEYARRAGDQAAALLAYEEAARLYQLGLAALELGSPGDEEMRCELLLALGDAEARRGDIPTAMETFADAAELARDLNAPKLLARAALGYGGRWVWFRAGKDRRLIDLLEDALAALPPGEANDLRAMLLARLAGALRDQPVPERRSQLAAEALEIARGLDSPRTLAHAVGAGYSAFSWPRDLDAWHAMATELYEIGGRIGDKEQSFFGHFHAFGAFMVRGDIDAASREFRRMRLLVEELRQPPQLWIALAAEATWNLFTGRLAEADEIAARADEIGFGSQGMDATYHYVTTLQRWAVRREQGRLDEVEGALEAYLREYPGVFVMRCALAGVYSELGRDDMAREQLGRIAATEFADLEHGTEWFLGATLLAGVCERLGDTAGAEPLYAALLPYGDFNVYAHPEVCLGSASRPLGLLAATMSRWDDAERHFERAVEMNERMGARPWVAHTRHEHARMLEGRGAGGDAERAAELLRRARDDYEQLGMSWWRDSAAAALENGA